jgi:hypothetical protein
MTTHITRTHAATGDRYEIDAMLCPAGWAQLDTNEDASWYGIWAHPKRRTVSTYCEGDISVATSDTDEEFCQEVRRVASFHTRHDGWLRIDPVHGDRSAWVALGLEDLLA